MPRTCPGKDFCRRERGAKEKKREEPFFFWGHKAALSRNNLRFLERVTLSGGIFRSHEMWGRRGRFFCGLSRYPTANISVECHLCARYSERIVTKTPPSRILRVKRAASPQTLPKVLSYAKGQTVLCLEDGRSLLVTQPIPSEMPRTCPGKDFCRRERGAKEKKKREDHFSSRGIKQPSLAITCILGERVTLSGNLPPA
ncbi:hypothetical protein CDAR_105811 [Caerostris darwini]|uniref:Uncharacterized protein n=1 Tax=Caerostris darwini TaxID=1538125 RepID=A0AAV4TT57_9ARAC|nr:hypothetical protein CDAR_105811 [Caerostris darwini]